MGTARRIAKLLTKENTLLRSNGVTWWMTLSLEAVWSQTSPCWEVCLHVDWMRPEMCRAKIMTDALFSDTKQHLFYACVVHQVWEIDMVPTVPKMHLRPRKMWAQHGAISRLECIRHPQHILCHWPFKMSTKRNGKLYYAKLISMSSEGEASSFNVAEMTQVDKHFLLGIPLTGRATWTTTLTLIQWRELFPQTNVLTGRALRNITSPSSQRSSVSVTTGSIAIHASGIVLPPP